MPQVRQNVSPALQHLGRMLHQLRVNSGRSGAALGAEVNLGQPTISKIETGNYGMVDWGRLQAYLDVLTDDPVQVAAIRRQYELAQLDPNSYRVLADGDGYSAKQLQFLSLEKTSRFIRYFENVVVPGLLQTPAYSYAVFRELGAEHENAIRSSEARSARQVILNDPSRRFVFLISDSCTYGRPQLSPEEHQLQLDQLLARSSAANVVLRVIRTDQALPLGYANPFVIIDRRYVSAETTVKEVVATAQPEIEDYEAAFDELCRIALPQDESRSLIAEAMS